MVNNSLRLLPRPLYPGDWRRTRGPAPRRQPLRAPPARPDQEAWSQVGWELTALRAFGVAVLREGARDEVVDR
jgi:hypothetical protein